MDPCILDTASKTSTKDHCVACTKSGLPILVLRPSVVALDAALAPTSIASLKSPTDVLTKLVPNKALKKTRYALRTMRAGYLYVYYEKPPTPNQHWDIYRVTDDGDLIRRDQPTFNQTGNVACTRSGHNAMAMKVLHIPNAHTQTTVWLAFSANLWDTTLLARNAANAKVMYPVDIAALVKSGRIPDQGFSATADAIGAKVAEYTVESWTPRRSGGNDFPFKSLKGEQENLCKSMAVIAAAHSQTKGKAIALVLADPAGVAAELNELRLRRHEQGLHWMYAEPRLHPLQTSQVVQSLHNQLSAQTLQKVREWVIPVMSSGQFEDWKRAGVDKSLGWSNARWVSFEEFYDSKNSAQDLAELRRMQLTYGFGWGFVIYDDMDSRIPAEVERRMKRQWARYERYYNENQRAQWETNFHEQLHGLHTQPLALFEHDWNVWIDSDALKSYFALHFDGKAKNDPKEDARRGCCSGGVYCREAVKAFAPAPFTDEPTTTFEQQLDKDIASEEAILKRAALFNQMSVIEQLVTDAGEGAGKRDKFYDFMKGLITFDMKINGKQVVEAKLSWLTNTMLGFSGGISTTLASVAYQGAAKAFPHAGASLAGAAQSKLQKMAAERLAKALHLAVAQNAAERAYEAVIKGAAPKVPVLLVADLDPQTAIDILRGRGQSPKAKTIKNMLNQRTIRFVWLTDSEELSKLQGDSQAALKAAASAQKVTRVEMRRAAASLEAKTLGNGATVVLTLDQVSHVYQRQMQAQAVAAQTWKNQLLEAAKSPGLKQFAHSLDTRLALGSVIVQGLGIVHGMSSFNKAAAKGDEVAKTDAVIGMLDSAAGMMGGSFELMRTGTQVALQVSLGAAAGDAIKASAGIALLRSLGSLMGVAGNAVNAYANWRTAEQMRVKGNFALAGKAQFAAIAFGIGAFPFLIATAHALTQSLVNAGLSNAALRTSATALGRVVATRVIGVAIIPGLGWIVTAIAVGYTIYVEVNKPSEFEQWLKDGFFGNREGSPPGLPKYKNWDEAEAELKQIMGGVAER
jgi:hypothetical protein